MSFMTSLALVLLIAAVLFPAPAHAYVDPGTGSMVLQGIIAAVLGLGLTLKLTWRRIRRRLTGKSSRDNETDADQ
jgi:type VI protein secretion system component VasK